MADTPGFVPPDHALSGWTDTPYPARLQVAYPDQLNRVTTAFRLVLAIPILIVGSILTGEGLASSNTGGHWITTTTAGITGGLSVATLLLILFRQRYPRWWFDFVIELARFGARIGAYPEAAGALCIEIRRQLRWNAVVPKYLERVRLD